MKKKKIILVKAAQDREFKNSYWSFDIPSESARAFQEFKRQFGIGFKLTDIGKWDPIHSLRLRSFPLNLIQTIPKGVSIKEVIDYLVNACQEKIGLFLEIPQDEKNEIYSKLKSQPLKYQIGFLEARLESWLKDYLFQDLEEKAPINPEIGAIIALTGKFSIKSNWSGTVRKGNLIFTKKAYILIRNYWTSSIKPSKVILHELGHLFGAKDIEDSSVVSVMTQKPEVITYEFDDKNKQIIFKKIKKLKELN